MVEKLSQSKQFFHLTIESRKKQFFSLVNMASCVLLVSNFRGFIKIEAKSILPKKPFSQRRSCSDEKERENCKKAKQENQSREPPLARTNTQLDSPVCPHDSQSGQQTHNKRDRNIPTQCHQSPRQAVNCQIELGCGLREGKKKCPTHISVQQENVRICIFSFLSFLSEGCINMQTS